VGCTLKVSATSKVEHPNRISRLTRENRFRRSLTSRPSRGPETRTDISIYSKPNRQKRPGKMSHFPSGFHHCHSYQCSDLLLLLGTVILYNRCPLNLTLVGAARVEAIHYQFDQLMDHPHRRNLGPRVICLSSCPWRVSLPVISTSPIAAVGLRLPVASTPEGSRSWSTLPHSATRLRHSNLLLLPIAWFCIRNGGYCMSLPSSVALFTVAASSSLRANADGSHEGRIQYYAVNQWLPIFIVRTILCWTGRSTRVCFACFLHRHF
jgi:hypothetical protein